MSNTQVGNVYNQIIMDVIEASRVDFEEGGVEESVLEELKTGWQKKLSQQQLAVFPWDPKPDPPAPAPIQQPPQHSTAAPAPAAPAPPQYSQSLPAQNGQGLSLPLPAGQPQNGNPPIKAEPGVKTEPGLENVPATNPNVARGANTAYQRATENLARQFGSRADASINALNAGIQTPAAQYDGQSQPTGQQQQVYQGQAAPNMSQQQQYRSQMLNQAAAQQQRAQQASNTQRPAIPQTDGTNDVAFDGVLVRRDTAGNTSELGRVEIDHLLRSHIESRAKRLEGGGLMLPLKQATKHRAANVKRSSSAVVEGGAFDGPDDDMVKDEDLDDDDAINSDLDDPDDNLEEDDEDEDGSHIMLCMYDKVQRVKNKWKCVLKDGVLTVNGKDYVFHKATGEYEW